MRTVKSALKYVQGAFYVVAGMNHFINPGFYLKIMPSYLPWHEFLVFASGIFEVLLGVLLVIPRSTRLAAWGARRTTDRGLSGKHLRIPASGYLPGCCTDRAPAAAAFAGRLNPVGLVVHAG
jgi:hypothetical protein